MAAAETPAAIAASPADFPRKLPSGEGVRWWGHAFRIFAGAPIMWIVLLVIYVAAMWLIDRGLARFPIVQTLIWLVLYPLIAAATVGVSQRIDRNEEVTFGDL